MTATPQPDTSRPEAQAPSARRRAALLGTAFAVAVAGVPLGAAPAAADVLPVLPPQSIKVFPQLDAVRVAGFEEPVVVEVWRNGVRVGSSGAPVRSALLDLNLDSASCWSGWTPDIVPGDEIRVVTDSSDPAAPVGQFVTAADLRPQRPELLALDDDGVADDLVMRGTARDGSGPAPIGDLTATITQPAFRSAGGWDRRRISAEAGGQLPAATHMFAPRDVGVLASDPIGPGNPDGSRWTAIWKNLPAPIGQLALTGHATVAFTANDGEDQTEDETGDGTTPEDETEDETGDEPEDETGDETEEDDAADEAEDDDAGDDDAGDDNRRRGGSDDDGAEDEDDVEFEDTVDEDSGTVVGVGDTGGPRDGCPAPVTDAVTMTSVPHVNLAARTAGGTFVIGGTAVDATSVRVTIDDSDATSSDAVTASAVLAGPAATPTEGAQTWTARIPMSAVTSPALADGTLTITGLFKRATTETVPGRPLHLLKDLVAPQPPTVSPPGGRYYDEALVTATAADPAQETVRHTADWFDAEEPRVTSSEIPVPYEVYDSQQLKVASYDRAGNRSATVTHDYEIRARSAPSAPRSVTATPQTGAAVVRWSAPSDNGGAAVQAYRIRVHSGDSTVRTVTVGTGTSARVNGLTNNRPYMFDVAAVNAIGVSAPSARTATVVPRTEFVAPTVKSRTGSGLSPGGNVTVVFSEPVSGVGAGTVQLLRGSTRISATVSYDAAKRTATLNPYGSSASKLGVDTRYTVALRAGITDTAGNPLTPTSWSLTTGPRPWVVSRSPGGGATGVRRTKPITVTFSENVTAVSARTIQVTRAVTGATVPGTVSYNPATRTAAFDPYGGSARVLDRSATYRVTVTSGVRDRAGHRLSPVTWTFRTRSG